MDINTAVKGAVIFARPVDGLPALRAEIAHHVPGRLRLRSALLNGNPCAAEEARCRLANIEGVTSVTANPSTGGLLLSYNPEIVAPRDFVELLMHQGHISAPDQTRADPRADWTDKPANLVKSWLIDAVAERLAFVVIGALI